MDGFIVFWLALIFFTFPLSVGKVTSLMKQIIANQQEQLRQQQEILEQSVSSLRVGQLPVDRTLVP